MPSHIIDTFFAKDDTNLEEAPVERETQFDQGWAFDSLPEDLIETFRQEAREHVTAIGDALTMLDLVADNATLLEGIRRSAHTLRGAAETVGLHQLGSLASRMERVLGQIHDGGLSFEGDPKALLFATCGILSDLSDGKGYSADLHSDAMRLHACYEKLDSTGTGLGKEKIHSFTSATACWEEDSVASDLAEIFQEEAAELLAAAGLALGELTAGAVTREKLQKLRRPIHTLKGAAGTVGMKQTSNLAKRLQFLLEGIEEEQIADSTANLCLIQETYPVLHELCRADNRTVELRRNVEELHARFDAVIANAPQPAEDPSGAIPADMAEIFRIEAEELLVRIGEALRALENDQVDGKPWDELRRDVHTLKGAAASVGLRAFGHLAHRMEDLFDAFKNGTILPSADAHGLLRDTTDAMAMMAAGANSEVAATLFARYAQLLDGGPVGPAAKPKSQRDMPAPAARNKSALMVRVPIERLDELVRMASELMVNRSTFEQQLAAYAKEVGELQLSLARLKRISSRLDSDFEVSSFQTGYGHLAVRAVHSPPNSAKNGREEFDPLEFDRYTDFHLVSRDLNETSSDIGTAANELSYRIAHFDSYLSRLGTLTSDIQDKIMRIRMVPLQSLASRLERTLRATCERTGKRATMILDAGHIELDKGVLEEISGPLDHIVRNAVDHGIEDTGMRLSLGKPEHGLVRILAFNQGTEVVIEVTDDGGGLRPGRLRETALRKGLYTTGELDAMSAGELHNLIFKSGFSTAAGVNEISGRGVGMDVVRAAVNKLRGTIAIESEPGGGTKFIIRLPMSLAIMRVLLVRSSEGCLAIPLASIHRVLRVDSGHIDFDAPSPRVRFGEKVIPVHRLGDVLGLAGPPAKNMKRVPILVFDFGEGPVAFAVDHLMEAREVVVKSLGGLLRRVPGISGATLMGDGSVVLIVEPAGLVRMSRQSRQTRMPAEVKPHGYDVMVVDDSVSVRRVLSNLITKCGWTPTSAKDGVEALEILQRRGSAPDVILLDIEMPRMDGYDLVGILRSDSALKQVPVIMLTSRSGDKHRRKAFELGATDYLVKPYQEETLLAAIRNAVESQK